jgi:uncharacterized membrane protein required for colicin V production
MNGIDVILIVALVAFTVNGFAKGLFAKALSLAALLGGIVLSEKYGGVMAEFLARLIGFGTTICGVIVIAGLFIVLFVISGALAKGLKKVAILQVFDKVGGALFGFLEGALILSLLLVVLGFFSIPPPGPTLKNSFMYSPVRGFAPNVYKTFISKKTSEHYLDKFFFSKHS